MKINNNIRPAKPFYAENFNKSQKPKRNNTSFKGRIINDKNLKRFGNTAIYTSLLGQGVAYGTGNPNSFFLLMNGILGSLGGVAHTARFFIKDRELLKLKPEIIFHKSETLEQAANFAKENFKIKDFDVDNLDTANWINEGLTRLSNRFKGKTFMPDKIKLVEFPQSTCKDESITAAQYQHLDNKILFNKSIYKDIDVLIQKALDCVSESLLYRPLGANQKSFLLPHLIEKYKETPNSFSTVEKTSLYSAIIKKIEILNGISENPNKVEKITKRLAKDKTNCTDVFCNVSYNPYDCLHHEMGHLFDLSSNSTVQQIIANSRSKKIFEKAKENMILPQLAESSFQEFTAEMFAGIMNGDKYPKYLMDLFKKINNIKLPD